MRCGNTSCYLIDQLHTLSDWHSRSNKKFF